MAGKTEAEKKRFIEKFRKGELKAGGRGLVKEALTGSGYEYDPATGKYVRGQSFRNLIELQHQVNF